MPGNEDYSYALRFGESWEKLAAMRELEEVAKACRVWAEQALAGVADKAEIERKKPWREFRRRIGFGLFGEVLDIAQGPPGSELRDLAADILAHLWHPAAVDRLIEDLKVNGKTLLPSQYTGIFTNLGGIGNEPAVRALMELWDDGCAYDAVAPLGACGSRTSEAFLMRQARENKDQALRGYCICYLNSMPTQEKVDFLREKLKRGTGFERSAAVRKIAEMGLRSMVPELMAVYDQSEDAVLREEIFATLRYMRKP